MIHAKLLLRRLAHVPWLLAIGLALIELTATPVAALELTAMPNVIREDAGETEIALEVTLDNALTADTTVLFTIPDSDDDINELTDPRFDDADDADRDVDYRARIQPLVIPKGETKGTTTMTVTPIDNRQEDGLRAFVVTATVGSAVSRTGILITDDETPSSEIWLEVSPSEVYEGAGATEVVVTGTLNGKTFKDNVIVVLIISDDVNGDGKMDADDKAATRDLDYTANIRPLVIPGGAVSGTTTITITPIADDTKESDEKIYVKSSGEPTARADDGGVEELDVVGVTITLKDAGLAPPEVVSPDNNANASFVLSASPSTVSEEMEEATVTVTATLDGGALASDVTVNLSIDPASTAEEDEDYELDIDDLLVIRAGSTSGSTEVFLEVEDDGEAEGRETIILNGSAGGGSTVSSVEITLTDQSGQTGVTQFTVTPSSIREDAGQTQIELTVSLTEAKDAAETVTFTLAAPSQGVKATRDLDYAASLVGSPVTIPAGATVGKATLTLTPINNDVAEGLRAIGVQATFASGATLLADITIVDDETPNTSTSITLSVSPQTISEEDGETTVTVTATWDGKALSENKAVTVTFGSGSTASRDVDYIMTGFSPWIEIPAGSTTGSMQFTLHPILDKEVEGNETIKLTGTIDGLRADEVEITLTDSVTPNTSDETASTAITLSASPSTVSEEIEDATVRVTATLNGGALASDVTVNLSIDPASTAEEDEDYELDIDDLLVIRAGSTSGSTEVFLEVEDDGESEGSETIILNGSAGGGLTVSSVEITLTDQAAEPAEPDDSPLAFAASAVIDNQEYTAGKAITPLVLPEAMGGTAPLTYSISSLPAGLSFDSATRTISGTPTAATDGASPVVYQVTDADGQIAVLTFTITVNKKLTIDLSDLFGSGKVIPTPTEFALAHNYPNPFNPATTIQYALPQAADVELTVYNVVGQVVRTLVAEHQGAGRYTVEWDATDDGGHSVSAGLYLYRLQAGGEFAQVKKMLLLK